MKMNSKFVANLFKSCGLLVPFVVVSCAENPETEKTKSNDELNDLTFVNGDNIANLLKAQGFDIEDPNVKNLITEIEEQTQKGNKITLNKEDLENLKNGKKVTLKIETVQKPENETNKFDKLVFSEADDFEESLTKANNEFKLDLSPEQITQLAETIKNLFGSKNAKEVTLTREDVEKFKKGETINVSFSVDAKTNGTEVSTSEVVEEKKEEKQEEAAQTTNQSLTEKSSEVKEE